MRNVRPATLIDLIHVCRHMRPDEIEQTLAFGYADAYDPDDAAVSLYRQPGPKLAVLGRDGMPVMVGGAMEIGPGVYSGWTAGTMEGWQTEWRHITRVTRRFIEELLAGPAHRVQLTALASRARACHWYTKGLKMQAEGVRRAYGRNGEDAIEFSRVRGNP
jgi:hypothetical protein